MDEHERLAAEIAGRAKVASRLVAKAPAARRTAAIEGMARALESGKAAILEANRKDVAQATDRGVAPAMVDRLMLDGDRLAKMSRALVEVAGQADPVGEVVHSWRRPNGLRVAQQRLPLGVVLMIYEARPNVTSDAAGLCVRSGNAVVLRGGSEAFASNSAIAEAMRRAVAEAGLPADAVQLFQTTDRAAMQALLRREDEIDLCIPRGGEGLIRFVAEHSRIPVIKHYRGNCHVFVDRSADPEMALAICENAKASRPAVCNAAETILVHAGIADTFLPRLAERMVKAGVELRADEATRRRVPGLRAATEEDLYAEFLDLVCAVAVVPDLDAAIAHIEKYGSSHTEAIVTRDLATAQRFRDEVSSSTVVVNASTRFADGGELGLGAEIGISTTKLHAYGPMGALGLTTLKFVIEGEGQIR
jgi:glutamate-5-semialdehyde dehydrogenase